MLGDTRTEFELLQPLDPMTYSIQASDRLKESMADASAQVEAPQRPGRSAATLSIYVQSLKVTQKEMKMDPNKFKESGLYRWCPAPGLYITSCL